MPAAIPAAVPATPAAPPQGNDALRVILIVVGAIAVLGVLGIGTLTFVVRRIAHNSHIKNENGNVRVETPFGAVQSTNNPEEASQNLGIDPYPGARVVRGSSTTVAGMRTVSAEFETDDSAQKVLAFYSPQFPKATVTTQDQNRFTLVSTDNKNIITINVEPQDGKTRIAIANVSGKNLHADNSSD